MGSKCPRSDTCTGTVVSPSTSSAGPSYPSSSGVVPASSWLLIALLCAGPRAERLERQRLVVFDTHVVGAGGALDEVPDALAQQLGDLLARDTAARQPPRSGR